MTAAAEAVEFSPTSLQRQDEDATRWVEAGGLLYLELPKPTFLSGSYIFHIRV